MTEPTQDQGDYWSELERAFADLDQAMRGEGGIVVHGQIGGRENGPELILPHVAPFGPTGNETTAVALHPSGRGPRGEILRQLDRIEYDLGRARAALRWMAVGLALQLGAAIVLVYALATRR